MRWLRGLLKLLENSTVALAVGFALGLALGEPVARIISPLTLPALALLIAVAASEVSTRVFRQGRRLVRATLLATASSYVVLSGAILLLAGLFVPEPELYTGYVLVAAAPPAAIALGFAGTLRADLVLSVTGAIGAYLLAPLIGPLIALAFARPGLIQPVQLLQVLLELIVIPIAASRLLRIRPLLPYVRRWRHVVINWAFALVLFIVVGVNRTVFFQQPAVIGPLALVALGATFGVGTLATLALRRLRIGPPTRISVVLFMTLKNSGFAAGVALALVSQRASLPGAVFSVVVALYVIWLGLIGRRSQA